MNDEFKEWIRILKFGMPSVVSYAFVLSGMGLMIFHFNNDPITGFQGLSFSLIGLLISHITDNVRLRNKLEKSEMKIDNLKGIIDNPI